MLLNHPRARVALRGYVRLGALLFCAAMLGALSAPARAQTVTAAVPLTPNTSPRELAVNPVTNEIYVLDAGTGYVTAINGATNHAVSIPVGSSPDALAIDTVTNTIYVCNAGSSGGESVSVINGATNAVIQTIALGPFSTLPNPIAVAVNPVTNRIYVANNGSSNVSVISGVTTGGAPAAVVATIHVDPNPIAVAVNPVTNMIYVPSNSASGTVSVIDGSQNTVTATVPVGASPVSVAVNPVTNEVYVANSGSGNIVTVIDGSNNTANIAAGTTPFSVALNPVTNRVYVANLTSSNVTVIDGGSNTPITNVAVGSAPLSLAVNPMTNKIYVASEGNSTVTVIDGATNAPTTLTLPASSLPFSVGENPVTNKIYVANAGGNSVSVIDGATNATTTVAAGSSPAAVALNPATDKIYVANSGDGTVTAIDGATQTPAQAPITVGSVPDAIAVNPITNQIYVANSGEKTVTDIDGASSGTTPIPVGSAPDAVAVNPVTNQIYVANSNDGTVTLIDGSSGTPAPMPIPVGADPVAIAVNPATNEIYVANSNDGTVTLIDGSTGTPAPTPIPVGSKPSALAVDVATDTVYVANSGGSTVTAIDRANNTISNINVGLNPVSVAVDPVSNQIYVADSGDGTVKVIDGTSNTVLASLDVGGSPQSVAVNPVTNKIYVPTGSSNSIAVIDGSTGTIEPDVAADTNALAVAVNPVTNNVYVVNKESSDVTAVAEQQVQTIPLSTTITPLASDQTSNPTPTFTFTASSAFSPTAPPPNAVYFQVDTWQGPWSAATAGATAGTFTGTTATLPLGVHILYAFATDGQDSSSTQVGGNQFADGNSLIGNITAYLFLVTNQGTTATASQIALASSTGTLQAGSTALLTATIEDASGSPITSGSDSTLVVTFAQTTGNGTVTGLGTATASGGIAKLQVTGDLAGPVTITASATSVEGNVLADGTGNPTQITVTAGTPSKLVWTVEPSATDVGQTISPAPQVSVEDQYGNVVTDDSSRQISVAIATNPSSGQLAGTLTQADSNGVATFDDLSIDQAGKGYQLAASSTNLIGGTSDSFDITPIPTETGLVSNLTAIQYSDGGLNLNATVRLSDTSGGAPAGSLAFELVGTDGLACSGATPAPRVISLGNSNLTFSNGKATATLNGIRIDDPCAWSLQSTTGDSYTLKAVFTSSNANYANSTDTAPLQVTPEVPLTTTYTGSQYVLAASGTTSATATLSASVAQTNDGYLVSFNQLNSAPPSGGTAGCSASDPTACRIYVEFQLSGGTGSCGGGVYYAPVYDSATAGLGIATLSVSLPSPCTSNLTTTLVQDPVAGNGSYLYWTPKAAAASSVIVTWPGTTNVMGSGSVVDPSTNGVDSFAMNAMYNSGEGLVGSSTLSYSSTYGAACMTSTGNTGAPVNVQISTISFTGMSQNTALNELQLSGYAVVNVTNPATGATLCSFGPGTGPNFFVTAVDSKTAPPGFYGAQFYLSNGALYRSIAGPGPGGTVALGSGTIDVHLK